MNSFLEASSEISSIFGDGASFRGGGTGDVAAGKLNNHSPLILHRGRSPVRGNVIPPTRILFDDHFGNVIDRHILNVQRGVPGQMFRQNHKVD